MQEVLNKEQEKAGLEAQRRIGMCKRVVARMLKQELALAWALFFDGFRTFQRKRIILLFVFGRIKKQSACSAFGRWCQIASKRRRLRLVVQRAIGRLHRMNYIKALSTWLEHFVRQRHLRAVICKICVRMFNRSWRGGINAAVCFFFRVLVLYL